MICRLLIALIAFLPMSSTLQAGWLDNIAGYLGKERKAKPPVIRVLVVHDQPGVIIEVKGKYKIKDPNTNEHISTRFVGKRRLIQAVRDGLKWGEEFPGVHQLVIIPDDKMTTTILIDGIEYRGLVYVYDVDGTISIVNETNIEDYLVSILSFPYRSVQLEEALAAIAIAARTTAYYQAENPKNKFWDADGRKVGYQGYTASRQPTSVERAIRSTRYMVMSSVKEQGENVNPFIVDWKQSGEPKNAIQAVTSEISLMQVEELAQQGGHAAQILNKAFPGAKIELIHYPTD